MKNSLFHSMIIITFAQKYGNRCKMRPLPKLFFFSLILAGILSLLFNVPAPAKVAAQQPTGSIPTVTGTASGPVITVIYSEQINVRSGPSTFIYAAIGVLLPLETAPALGSSPGGDWIQIRYPGVPGDVGWVYGPYVSLPAGATLRIVEPRHRPHLLPRPPLTPHV